MAEILDEKTLVSILSEEIKEKVKAMSISGIKPHFCVIDIGDDPASKVHARAKKRRAEKLRIDQEVFQLPAETTEEEALVLIQKSSNDPQTNGVMVQLPIPDRTNSDHLIEAISPEKDVGALTTANVGRLWQGTHFVKPVTAYGIIDLLGHYQISLGGKKAVIISRGSIVGKPLATLLLERNATVALAHSHTKNLAELTKQADILAAAVEKAKLVTADIVRERAVVIDVGINRIDGHLVGDADFDNVKKRISYTTPVPGGASPLTIESLMQQVVASTRRQNGKS